MEINDSNEISLPFMEKLSSDNISVENPEIQLMINNGLGLDAQIVLEKIAFKKNQNLLLQSLTHKSNNPLNNNETPLSIPIDKYF